MNNFDAQMDRYRAMLVEEALRVIDEVMAEDHTPHSVESREELRRKFESFDKDAALIQLLAETRNDEELRARWVSIIRPRLRAALAKQRPS